MADSSEDLSDILGEKTIETNEVLWARANQDQFSPVATNDDGVSVVPAIPQGPVKILRRQAATERQLDAIVEYTGNLGARELEDIVRKKGEMYIKARERILGTSDDEILGELGQFNPVHHHNHHPPTETVESDDFYTRHDYLPMVPMSITMPGALQMPIAMPMQQHPVHLYPAVAQQKQKQQTATQLIGMPRFLQPDAVHLASGPQIMQQNYTHGFSPLLQSWNNNWPPVYHHQNDSMPLSRYPQHHHQQILNDSHYHSTQQQNQHQRQRQNQQEQQHQQEYQRQNQQEQRQQHQQQHQRQNHQEQQQQQENHNEQKQQEQEQEQRQQKEQRKKQTQDQQKSPLQTNNRHSDPPLAVFAVVNLPFIPPHPIPPPPNPCLLHTLLSSSPSPVPKPPPPPFPLLPIRNPPPFEFLRPNGDRPPKQVSGAAVLPPGIDVVSDLQPRAIPHQLPQESSRTKQQKRGSLQNPRQNPQQPRPPPPLALSQPLASLPSTNTPELAVLPKAICSSSGVMATSSGNPPKRKKEENKTKG